MEEGRSSTVRRPYSHKGCSACKRRKKKCDEGKPSCQSCLRLGLSCWYESAPTSITYSLQPKGNNEVVKRSFPVLTDLQNAAHLGLPSREQFDLIIQGETDDANASRNSNNLKRRIPLADFQVARAYSIRSIESVASISPEATLIGDFHRMPVRADLKYEALTRSIQTVDISMKHAWPFIPQKRLRKELTDATVAPVMQSDILCIALAGVAAAVDSRGDTNEIGRKARLKYETLINEKLRHGIQQLQTRKDLAPSSDLLMAAVMLVWIVESYNCDGPTLRKLASGVLILLRRSAGPGATQAMHQNRALTALLRAELIASLANIDPNAYATSFERPLIPGHLHTPAADNQLYSLLIGCCSPEVVYVATDVKLLMRHRTFEGMEVSQINATDFWSLMQLLAWVSVQLCTLQWRYAGTKSISECVTYAMILIRMEMLADYSLHPRLCTLLFQRFYNAIMGVPTASWTQENVLTVEIWLLCIGIAMCRNEGNRAVLLEKLKLCLNAFFRSQDIHWPPTWREIVERLSQDFIWHYLLQARSDASMQILETARGDLHPRANIKSNVTSVDEE